MSIFIDTGVFFAAKNNSDVHHEKAKKIIRRIFNKEYGDAFTSDYVVAELVNLAYARTKRREQSIKTLRECTESPELFQILNVDEEDFGQTARSYPQYEELSFTDCSILTLMKRRGISNLATFDSGFRQANDIRIISEA